MSVSVTLIERPDKNTHTHISAGLHLTRDRRCKPITAVMQGLSLVTMVSNWP